MLRRRLIRHRGVRKKIKSFDLDITSLLDILVILLVFLLKNYSASNVTLNIPENISLPRSDSQEVNTESVVVQVSSERIWVDDKEVLNSNTAKSKIYDDGGRRIISLYNELVEKKNSFKLLEKATGGGQEFSGNVSLVVDKKIEYSYLKKLMYTCASAGFKEYKFVVLGLEE